MTLLHTQTNCGALLSIDNLSKAHTKSRSTPLGLEPVGDRVCRVPAVLENEGEFAATIRLELENNPHFSV
jgi:hypothetical protein